MARLIRIALVGDYDPSVTAHQAIPRAIDLAAHTLDTPVQAKWLPTEQIRQPDDLTGYHGIWCVPASPYRSLEGALLAIRHAREGATPFLGTCGGFQHAILEFARNVLGWTDAEHGETAPESPRSVIAPLACSLVEVTNKLRLAPESRLANAYGRLETREGYHCRYGLNPEFADELTEGPLRATAWDDTGEVRAVELDDHPFFVATLFQPERAALAGLTPPPAVALLQAALAAA